jgi:hypothetical protein
MYSTKATMFNVVVAMLLLSIITMVFSNQNYGTRIGWNTKHDDINYKGEKEDPNVYWK